MRKMDKKIVEIFANESKFSRFESHGKSYIQCRIRGNFV